MVPIITNSVHYSDGTITNERGTTRTPVEHSISGGMGPIRYGICYILFCGFELGLEPKRWKGQATRTFSSGRNLVNQPENANLVCSLYVVNVIRLSSCPIASGLSVSTEAGETEPRDTGASSSDWLCACLCYVLNRRCGTLA